LLTDYINFIKEIVTALKEENNESKISKLNEILRKRISVIYIRSLILAVHNS
jgi:hypothetical protein